MTFFKNSLAGKAYVILNIIRICNIIALLSVIAASFVMLVKTFMISKFFFFDGVSHLITAGLAIALIITEIGLFKNYTKYHWPLFAINHGFVTLGMIMVFLGVSMLGNLNKSATTQDSLGTSMWQCVISSGIVTSIMGIINIFASYCFRRKSEGLSARQIRRSGSQASQLATWADAAPMPSEFSVTPKRWASDAGSHDKGHHATTVNYTPGRVTVRNVSAPMQPTHNGLAMHDKRRTRSSTYSNDYQKGGQGGTGMPPVLNGTQRPDVAYHPAYQNISF